MSSERNRYASPSYTITPQPLSPRLEAALSLVAPGGPLWDICCDHGYLGVQAAARSISSQVHFCDSALDGMRRLYRRIDRSGERFTLEFTTEVCGIRCFGHTCAAEALPVARIDGSVAILGVGTATVISILQRWLAAGFTLAQVDRLILGTHTQVDRLADFLREQRWEVVASKSVDENGRQRPLWVVE